MFFYEFVQEKEQLTQMNITHRKDCRGSLLATQHWCTEQP